jgi:hypothetical protein
MGGEGNGKDEDGIDSILGLMMGTILEVWGSILGLA